MFSRLIFVIALSFVAISSASAGDDPAWYQKGFGKGVPTTFKAALKDNRELLGADNSNRRGHGGGEKVCAALRAVQISCDYNTRLTLSRFLALYGKGLFPASGGSNPYYTEHRTDDGLDDGFIGQPKQNEILAQAVTRNAKLFVGGDITAEAVKYRWQ